MFSLGEFGNEGIQIQLIRYNENEDRMKNGTEKAIGKWGKMESEA